VALAFQLLGPVQATVDERQVPLTSIMDRAVLATLLLAQGRFVSQSSLEHALWDVPPKSAGSNLRSYLSRLRVKLRQADPTTNRLIAPRGGYGYSLVTSKGELDVQNFNDLASQGHTELTRGNVAKAAETLGGALGLWSGTAGQDVTAAVTGSLQDELEYLDERRLTATEDYIDARIVLGGSASLTRDVRHMVLRCPLRERPWEQLMRVLYLCGDPDGGLDAFRRARRLFDDRLGIDPSYRLQAMHRAILQRDDDQILYGCPSGGPPFGARG
jgi:DNA-binding SARP family transcriptional activator